MIIKITKRFMTNTNFQTIRKHILNLYSKYRKRKKGKEKKTKENKKKEKGTKTIIGSLLLKKLFSEIHNK